MTPQELGSFLDALIKHKETPGLKPRNIFLGGSMMLLFWDMIGVVDGATVVERKEKRWRGIPVENYNFQADGVLITMVPTAHEEPR